MKHRRSQRGQATVEFAIVLPAVVIVLLMVFQALVLGHDYLVVANAAREAARAATVDPTGLDAQTVVHRSLAGATVTLVREGGVGSMVRATVRYRAATSLPIVGAMVPDVWITNTVTMRVER